MVNTTRDWRTTVRGDTRQGHRVRARLKRLFGPDSSSRILEEFSIWFCWGEITLIEAAAQSSECKFTGQSFERLRSFFMNPYFR